MTIELRLCLVICAAFLLLFVIRKIRNNQFSASDSLFWLALSFVLVLVAIFPGIAFFFSAVLGIQSPSNFVFLAVIALLLIREFSLQAKISKLEKKLVSLVQETALNIKK